MPLARRITVALSMRELNMRLAPGEARKCTRELNMQLARAEVRTCMQTPVVGLAQVIRPTCTPAGELIDHPVLLELAVPQCTQPTAAQQCTRLTTAVRQCTLPTRAELAPSPRG